MEGGKRPPAINMTFSGLLFVPLILTTQEIKRALSLRRYIFAGM
jgi:hypothetical protein